MFQNISLKKWLQMTLHRDVEIIVRQNTSSFWSKQTHFGTHNYAIDRKQKLFWKNTNKLILFTKRSSFYSCTLQWHVNSFAFYLRNCFQLYFWTEHLRHLLEEFRNKKVGKKLIWPKQVKLFQCTVHISGITCLVCLLLEPTQVKSKSPPP